MKKKRLILLTNDDGYFSEGLGALTRALEPLAEVYIVAPDREKSATSLSLTLRRPLRVQKMKARVYAVDGTPVDCIYLALKKLLPRKPDLVIAGINHGPNLGQQDVSYSGTVAGAIQGTYLQVPSLAVSHSARQNGRFDFKAVAAITSRLARQLLKSGLPQGVTLNINFPPPPFKGIKLTCLGEKRYNPKIIEDDDPRGRTYYWIGTGKPKPIALEGSDLLAVREGYISVTPLHTDLTDFKALETPAFKTLFSKLTC
jgi:5'-nucleotidase